MENAILNLMNQKGLAPILIVFLIAILGIGGYLIYTKTYSTPQPSSNLAPATPAPTTTDETANWKTYTNTEYALQINYPPDWEVRIDNNTNAFLLLSLRISDRDNSIDIRVLNQSLEAWKREYIFDSLEETEFNSLPAFLGTINSIGDREAKQYAFTSPKNKSEIVVIDYKTAISDPEKSGNKTVNQILSTFKFTQ